MYYLAARYTTAMSKLQEKKAACKAKMKQMLTEEVGGTEIIAVVIILVVVIALGIVFKDNIISIVNNIWSKVFGQDSGVTGGKPNDMSDPFGG